MKTLYLVRHAKSSWKHPELSDHERPLNKRGKKNAPFMGRLLKEMGVVADLIVSSPAKRAITTTKAIAEELEYPRKEIIADEQIYDNSIYALLRVIKSTDNKHDTLMLVGHNPSLTELADYFSGYDIDNIPTGGVFAIEFDLTDWRKVGENNGSFKFFEYPRKYEEL